MLIKPVRAVLLSIMLLASLLMLAMLVITTTMKSASVVVPVVASENQTDKNYILRAYNGHIAVFYGAITDSPAIETTIEVAGLRAVDREKLVAGITVQSYDDVLRLLEDFGS
ncbi:BofC C-terminal domain-containing protein [Sporobacter termitidis DSM 10068]|uniref:BofC C-terminal domain-containing protein n=1 Tax=Sporobacter termitidis DSM 10068 TaxID=1123282 RepID=A0A1M5Y2H4_9FIRM|nr:BofC C-terminal domain-containing protein [Sporobacter termitidis]SHI06237.1 BofC C-terminal domain-containing protein [Sporobacter termitidis DSM 10068]